MKNFEQNYADIENTLSGAADGHRGKQYQQYTPEVLLSMNHFALIAVAAELRTIRQLMEEKAK